MPQLFDARGNEFQGSLDQIGNGSITDARTSGGTISATNGEVFMDLNGKAVAVFEIRSAANSATYVFEGTLDGSNYYTIPVRPMPGSTITGSAISESTIVSVSPTAAIAAAFAVSATGYRRVRCRSSVTNSGSAVVTARATVSDYAIIAQPQPALLHVTATATTATATASLPAVAGMYHYITSIEVTHSCSVAVTGSAVENITTTNLPGSPAWTRGNALLVGQTIRDVNYEPSAPIKSLVANTATTVVCPANAAATTTSRINVSYYLGA